MILHYCTGTCDQPIISGGVIPHTINASASLDLTNSIDQIELQVLPSSPNVGYWRPAVEAECYIEVRWITASTSNINNSIIVVVMVT